MPILTTLLNFLYLLFFGIRMNIFFIRIKKPNCKTFSHCQLRITKFPQFIFLLRILLLIVIAGNIQKVALNTKTAWHINSIIQ